MITVKMAVIPKCNFCKTKDAIYDAPTTQGSWAYMCEDCSKVHGHVLSVGVKLIQQTPAKPKDGPAIIAKELSSMEEIVMDSGREVECPDCGDTRRVEPDAEYEYDCEGCGIKLKCQAVI